MTLDPETIHRRRWWTLAVLCLSLVLVIVGNTVLNVAIPTLARELDASNSQLQWMVDAYALVFAGLLLTSGALGDRFGRKLALNTGLFIFIGGALVSAFAAGSTQIIVGRAIMGVGASLVMPATLSILTAVFPPNERAKAIAIWAGLSGAGAAIGPVASGYMLEHFWWGSVFLLSVPIAIIALIAGMFFVPSSKDPEEAPLDPLGAILSIIGLGALVYGFIEAPSHGWTATATLLAFGIAIVALVMFGLWEHINSAPMLDLDFFKRAPFSAGSGAIILVFFAMFGTFFLFSQFLQLVLNYDPLEAGIRMLPMALTMVAVAPNSARLAAKIGTRSTMSLGLFIVSISLALFTVTMRVDSSYLSVILPLMLMASGMAITMAPATGAIMSSLPLRKAGVGSAVNDTTRELGGALGVAILGSIVASTYASKIKDVIPAGTSPAAAEAAKSSLAGAIQVARETGDAALAAVARQAFVDGMHIANWVGAGVALVASLMVLRFMPVTIVHGLAEMTPLSGDEHLPVEETAQS